MGFLDRFRSRKTENKVEVVQEVPSEPPKMYKVTINLPSYFKADKGEYHIFIDGTEHVCAPFSNLVVEIPEGTHEFRVFSTPETLGEALDSFEIVSDCAYAVKVDVRNKSISIAANDKLRSRIEFEEKFKKENGIKKLEP